MTQILYTPPISLQTLMVKLIDYAGLFPPTNLDLPTALENYARYQHSAEKYMLARFIIPAARLDDITVQMMGVFSAETPLRLSILSSDLRRDLPRITTFRNRYTNRVVFDLLEQKLAPALSVAEIVADNRRVMREADLPLSAFYELPFDTNWGARLAESITALAACNQKQVEPVGFKLRCGGVVADAFPSVEQVARAIILCRDADLKMKFTAGLHHPIRHFNASVNTKMHGFINVFVGAMLAHAHHLSITQLAQILADENADHFTFTDQHIGWHEVVVSAETILTQHRPALTSFGSCSFDEPRQDLQTLGLLN